MEWTKSTYSVTGNCVEVAFFKSSYSGGNACVETAFCKSSFSYANGCVEVGQGSDHVHVRDSKNPGGPVLTFNPHEWQAFLDGVRNGEFDLGRGTSKGRDE